MKSKLVILALALGFVAVLEIVAQRYPDGVASLLAISAAVIAMAALAFQLFSGRTLKIQVPNQRIPTYVVYKKQGFFGPRYVSEVVWDAGEKH